MFGKSVYFMLVFSIAVLSGVAAAFSSPEWEPPGIARTGTPVSVIVNAYTHARGVRGGNVTEQYRLTSPNVSLDVSAVVQGLDYRIETSIDGATYQMGRIDGKRWRRTPQGVVRIIESDVQGDDLDRWPEAVLGFDTSSCTAPGDTSTEWVLECKPIGDVSHWFYVDKASAEIVREYSRDGTRVVRFDFDDFRPTPDGTIPFHWKISGAGGNADVHVAVVQAAASEDPVSIPKSGDAFDLSQGLTVAHMPVHFKWNIQVPVSVNGTMENFVVDTGTTQILMDVGAAARAGLHSTLGHAVAAVVRVGDAVSHGLAIQTVDLFGGHGFNGLLGNEFFRGHIVHLDYEHQRLDLISRDGFIAPKDAIEVPVDYSEGMPLIGITVDSTSRHRVALDTGSQEIVLTNSYFSGQDAARPVAVSNHQELMNFLEGPIHVQPAQIHSFGFSKFRFDSPDVDLVKPQYGDLDFPLDGILGDRFLKIFEWWFDYDGNRAWVREQP